MWLYLFVCLFAVIPQVASHSFCRGLNCLSDQCLPTGECLNGCNPGFLLTKQRRCVRACTITCRTCAGYDDCRECNVGYFGPACEKTCGEGCLHSVCNKESGICLRGCIQDRGYVTEKCVFGGIAEGEMFIYICIGIAATALVVVFVVVVVVLILRCRNKNRYMPVLVESQEDFGTK